MGGVLIPMSKPKRIPIGTSENLLKGEILSSIEAHSFAMNGVFTRSRLDNVAKLGVVGD
jgi:hypothetical protein